MNTATQQTTGDPVAGVLTRYEGARSELVPILQDVQNAIGYVSLEAMRQVAEFLNTPESTVFGVATFYTQFRLAPAGRHTVRVCEGTACHVRGGARLMRTIRRRFGIRPGETTPDGRFTLDRVACLGSCALAPAMVVDDTIYGKLTPEEALEILEKLS
jgi:NADH-quinone oxidoreductase subunit E